MAELKKSGPVQPYKIAGATPKGARPALPESRAVSTEISPEGRRAKVTTRAKIDGRRNFIGTIIGSDEEAVTLGFDETVISIPLEEIEKARLASEVKNAKGSE